MAYIKDFIWQPNMNVSQLVQAYSGVGYQSIELHRAKELIVKIKKNNAKTYLTFTSNLVTSGLRGLFAQLITLGMVDVIVTTIGGLEEDIMKAKGEQFQTGSFQSDDVELHEQGINRVGNIHISNESYMNFEDALQPLIKELYAQQQRWSVSEFLRAIGLRLKDKNSILYQAAQHKVPIFCPAITDGATGFHLYLFQQDHKDFVIDVVKDFGNILFSTTHDEPKAVIALGGGVSKHHAILSTLLKGGAQYALFMTTDHPTNGSMGGANTNEAKSWGKVKDDSDAVTVIGDVTVQFPLVMTAALDELSAEGLLEEQQK